MTARRLGGLAVRTLGSGYTLPILVLVAWAVSVQAGWLDHRLWASPQSVVAAATVQVADGSLARDLVASLERVFAGFVVGAGAGLVVGVLMARVAAFDWLLGPMLNGVKQVALFAWIPLISIWLGSGDLAKSAFVALAAFFPVLLNAHEGVRSIDRRYLEVASVLCLSRWQRLRKVVLPAALPSIVTGVRLALIYSWLATIGAEYFFAAGAGIGNSMIDGRDEFRMDLVILGMALIGLVGFALNALAGGMERRLLGWRDR
jgi:sulfonate transport system permease protein